MLLYFIPLTVVGWDWSMENLINNDNQTVQIPPEGTSVDPLEGTPVDPPEGTPIDPLEGSPVVPLVSPWRGVTNENMAENQKRQSQPAEGTSVDYVTSDQSAAKAKPDGAMLEPVTVETDSEDRARVGAHDANFNKSNPISSDSFSGQARHAVAAKEFAEEGPGDGASVSDGKPASAESSDESRNQRNLPEDSLYVIEIDIPDTDKDTEGQIPLDDPVRNISPTVVPADQEDAAKFAMETIGEDKLSAVKTIGDTKDPNVAEASAERQSQWPKDPDTDKTAAEASFLPDFNFSLDCDGDESDVKGRKGAAFQEQMPQSTYAESRHRADSQISDTSDPGQPVPILQSSDVEDSPRVKENGKDNVLVTSSYDGTPEFSNGVLLPWNSAEADSTTKDRSFSSTGTESLLAGFIEPSYQSIENWTAETPAIRTRATRQARDALTSDVRVHTADSTVHAHLPYSQHDSDTGDIDSCGSALKDADSYSTTDGSLISIQEGKTCVSDLPCVKPHRELVSLNYSSRDASSKRETSASLGYASGSNFEATTCQERDVPDRFSRSYADIMDEAVKDLKWNLKLLGVAASKDSDKAEDADAGQTVDQVHEDAEDKQNALSDLGKNSALSAASKHNFKSLTVSPSHRNTPGFSDVVSASESLLIKRGEWKEDNKMSASVPKLSNTFEFERSRPFGFQGPKPPSRVIHMEGQKRKKCKQAFVVPQELSVHQFVMPHNLSPVDVRKLTMTKSLKKRILSFNEPVKKHLSQSADESRDSGIAGDCDDSKHAAGVLPPHTESTAVLSKCAPGGCRLSTKEEEELTYRDEMQRIMREVGLYRNPCAEQHQVKVKAALWTKSEEVTGLTRDSLMKGDDAALQIGVTPAADGGGDEADHDGVGKAKEEPVTTVRITKRRRGCAHCADYKSIL